MNMERHITSGAGDTSAVRTGSGAVALICKHCGAEITPNAERFPNRGPWLDSVDWSVCGWDYTNHAPKDEGC